MLVKTKVKTYPDGTQKTYVYKNPYYTGDTKNEETFIRDPDGRTEKEKEEERENAEYMNLVRTRRMIQDYCLSNDFDMFWTLTFAKDRENDSKTFTRLSNWLKYMKQKYGKFDYIFIPERHKDGCIHFHGVTGGFGGKMIDSGVKHAGEKVLNCEDWRHGFSTVTLIRDRHKTASYITKYVTKEMSQDIVGKGKKKYWSSQGLKLPVVKYLDYNPFSGCNPDWENDNIQIFNVYTV